MGKPLFKTLFFTWIILALLSACSGPAKTQIPTGTPTLSSSLTATNAPAPSAPQTSPNANPTAPDYWPTQDWRTSTPEQQGMDSAQISKVFDNLQQSKENVHSVLIIRNGTIVTEAYYAPFRPDARHNLNSITPTVVSILIGIAIQEGDIKGVNQKMLDFFPDRKIANLDARKQAITIQDLLTMTSGLREDDSGKDASDNWVQYVLDLPMDFDPGKFWNENGGGYHLLSAIIQKTTGMTPLAFANKNLFEPLGISDVKWLTDPQGINNGSGLMYLTSRDMAKIGYLYLNNGLWNGRQIVPKEYVLASTKHLFDVYRSQSGWGYGYGWYVAPDGSYFAEGYYGQVIDVKPEQDIVAIFTGGTAEDFSSNEEGLIDQLIIPAVKSPGALPENPASTALLNDQITALEKPAPGPILPFPKIAQTISGKKYLLEDGEAFTLTFTGDQATLDWSFKDQSVQFPIGIGNSFSTTPFDQTGMTSVLGATEQRLGQVFLALRGSWTGDDTFELTMQGLDSIRRHTATLTFAGDKVKVNTIQTEPVDNGNAPVSLQGQVQSP
jgi:CubicO group peptidase (beta-lactamase class C family)